MPRVVDRKPCFSSHEYGPDFTAEEIEFMNAIDRYKRRRQRPHPTWREVLAVAYSLGYRKVGRKSQED